MTASVEIAADTHSLRPDSSLQPESEVIVFDRVTRLFRSSSRTGTVITANAEVSLSIRQGEIFALLGHNGAGKTTLIQQLIGLLPPTSGEIFVRGCSVRHRQQDIRREIGYLPQSGLAMRWISVRDALEITGCLRGQSSKEAREQLSELASILGFGNCLDDLGQRASGGMLRLAHIAMAMMGRPSVLVLDEPTNELDPDKRRRFWEFIRRLNREARCTVLLVTHNVLEAERVVDRAAILREGRLIACDTPAKLRATAGRVVRLEVALERNASALAQLDSLQLGKRSAAADGNLVTTLTAPAAIDAATSVLELYAQGAVAGFQLAPPSLEDAYLSLDERGAALAPASSAPERTTCDSGQFTRHQWHLKSIRDFWLFVKEQLLEARSMWVWSLLFSVLMPLTMVFAIPRVGRGLGDATSYLYVVSGASVLAVATESILTLAQRIGALKREGTIVHYLSLPVAAGSYTLAVVAARLLLTLPAVLVPVLAGRFLYGLAIWPNPVLIGVALLTGMALSGIGLAIATLVPSLELIVMITNLSVYVLLMAAPVFIPATSLPEPLRWAGMLLPPTYAAEALRLAMLGDFSLGFFVDVAVLTFMSLFSVIASTRFFRTAVTHQN